VVAFALRVGREALATDTTRAFARTFAVGCVAGEDTARAAVLALKRSHPYTYRAQSEALALASNPAVARALVRMCGEDDRRLIGTALDVLIARGEVDIGVVAPLLGHVDSGVRERAAKLLALAEQRVGAAQLLSAALRREVEDDVTVAAAESLVLLGAEEGLEWARERLAEEIEDPGSMRRDLRVRLMMLLGIAGRAEDWETLATLFIGLKNQAAALGFHGHVALVEQLIAALEGGPDARAHLGAAEMKEAALALWRITGADLHVRSDGRIVDAYDLETSHAGWRAWWQAAKDRFDPKMRYRFGEPFCGLHSVAELERDGVPMNLRQNCATELGVLLRAPPLRLTDYARRQRDTIAAQRADVEAAMAAGDPRFVAGQWLRLGPR
jgi:hypothetical protein